MAHDHAADFSMPEMSLELVPVRVSDIERAIAFYESAGFRMKDR